MSAPEAERPFDAPWQAEAFAMTVHLSERGLFTWTEWAAVFGTFRKTDSDYWEDWVAALETILADRGAASPDALHDLRDAWHSAYATTPHGEPVTLDPQRG